MRPRLYRVETIKPKMTRAALHEHAVAFAEAEFARRGTVPFLWLIPDSQNIVWVETPWENEREKIGSIEFMRMMLRAASATAYAQIFEAYCGVIPAGPDGQPIREDMPASLADWPAEQRDDVLMIMTCDRNGEQAVSRYKVNLRPSGNWLGPRCDGEPMSEGRMFNLLQQQGACA